MAYKAKSYQKSHSASQGAASKQLDAAHKNPTKWLAQPYDSTQKIKPRCSLTRIFLEKSCNGVLGPLSIG